MRNFRTELEWMAKSNAGRNGTLSLDLLPDVTPYARAIVRFDSSSRSVLRIRPTEHWVEFVRFYGGLLVVFLDSTNRRFRHDS